MKNKRRTAGHRDATPFPEYTLVRAADFFNEKTRAIHGRGKDAFSVKKFLEKR